MLVGLLGALWLAGLSLSGNLPAVDPSSPPPSSSPAESSSATAPVTSGSGLSGPSSPSGSASDPVYVVLDPNQPVIVVVGLTCVVLTGLVCFRTLSKL